MVKHLVLGPGAMGYFMYLGVLSKLKQEGRFRTKVELWTDDDEIQIIR